ncbi:peptidyl-tRNA hydrolase, mitochondrial-like isoform X2 [Dioscorea cayenensis subsp. rotundata]|uniref:peptidyl-tRNA hydrolase n=1 Tax=Dioscorea cayennensis subsp. rotundata TaxID=55577 RepID=A0AB40BVN6_DIOCR|nr:peptidyl-tRNA hydrolase, mitochondrial-like isoform X2 [Dioscorea cayenensis subsp. rotundata]
MMLGASSLLNGLRSPLPSAHRLSNFGRGTKPMILSPPLSASASSSTSDQSKSKPWLLVGLGNSGKMYTGTRHNVGFEMIDAIAEAEGISVSTIRFKALFGKGFIGDAPVMLAKLQTFMNASGESVGSIVSYFHVPLNQVVLMYDDLDLPFAKLPLLPKGGHGGHNGMEGKNYAMDKKTSIFYNLII